MANNLVRRRRPRRTLQIGRKALAAVNVAPLGVLARLHILDHAQTQFTDGLGTQDFRITIFDNRTRGDNSTPRLERVVVAGE